MTKMIQSQVLQIVEAARIGRGKSEFLGADLRQANLKRANLKHTKLRGANRSRAKYDEATVWPARFQHLPMGASQED